jgi:hypothetical protein
LLKSNEQPFPTIDFSATTSQNQDSMPPMLQIPDQVQPDLTQSKNITQSSMPSQASTSPVMHPERLQVDVTCTRSGRLVKQPDKLDL